MFNTAHSVSILAQARLWAQLCDGRAWPEPQRRYDSVLAALRAGGLEATAAQTVCSVLLLRESAAARPKPVLVFHDHGVKKPAS